MNLPQGSVLLRRYRLVQQLGEGGIGTTYRALDLLEDEEVALKLLHSSVEDEGRDAFRKEFRLLCGLVHPNLTRVRDLGTALIDGTRRHFYTADLVQGVSLDVFAKGRPWSDARGVLYGVLEALELIHRLGVIHGDVKPENILVTHEGKAVLIDLSCARRLDEPCGEISGTPGYIAPEVMRSSQRVDARADLFAFGVTLERVLDVIGGKAPRKVRSLTRRLQDSEPEKRPAETREVFEILTGAEFARKRIGASGRSFELLGCAKIVEPFIAYLNDLVAGRPAPRALYICGGSGSGKSRLLRELKWRAELETEVIEGSIRTGGREAGPVLDLLSRACEISLPHGGVSSVVTSLELLAQRGRPCVLVLDDVHLLGESDRTLWNALLRSLDRKGPVFVLCTGIHEQQERFHSIVEQSFLLPLKRADITSWVGKKIVGARLTKLIKHTGGSPRLIEQVLNAIEGGDRFESALAFAKAGEVDLKGLSPDEHRALAVVVAHDGLISPPWPHEVSETLLRELATTGWLTMEGGSYRLARLAELCSFEKRLESGFILELRKALLSDLDAASQGRDYSPLAVRLLLHTGQVDEAASRFSQVVLERSFCPSDWLALSRELCEETGRSALCLAAARVFLEAGDPGSALDLLKAFDKKATPSEGADDALLRAEAELRLGRPDEALSHLELLCSVTDDTRVASAADLRARALITKSEYSQARDVASNALSKSPSEELETRLREDLALAAGYLGATEQASSELEKALAKYREARSSRGEVRVLSYQGILEYRRGDLIKAAEAYRGALEISTREAFDDHAASALLNLGTVYQEQGDWGGALESYERGLSLAIALDKVGSEAALHFNIANLYVEVGLVDRAETAQEAAEQLLRLGAASHLRGPLFRLAGEIAACRGSWDTARSAFTDAMDIFTGTGALREKLDCQLHLSELDLNTGEVHDVDSRLVDILNGAVRLGATDLEIRAHMLRSRLASTRADESEALRMLELALEKGKSSGQELLVAEAEAALAEIYTTRGAYELARSHQREARLRWLRVSATLPAVYREAFLAHRKRASVMSQPSTELTASPNAVDQLRARFRRFLQVNRKLSSSLSVEHVLEHAMDAAIELTSAERGFLILGEEKFKVSAARNIDRERIGRSHLKFSRTIAEEVIKTGQGVLTVDAQDDSRFREGNSIHAMRLQSVACVPIRGPRGAMGALYLDNRFQRGQFDEEDLDLLLAFADQLAIALTNAELHTRLERRTRELEVMKKKAEDLVRGQAQQIENLSAEVRAKQEVLEYRYDYSQIIGQSAPMRALFSTLDRVIDTPLTVLVQGESGTGKELVARAIHFNSSRKNGPLMSINCAALPDALLESELFGYHRGAFTGAEIDREGLLVRASGGTVFLDELGEMSLTMQTKLLRAIQEREVWPLGSKGPAKIDIRLLCATNRDLKSDAETGRFRRDLYYRISVVVLTLPPLRERTEDIPALVKHLLKKQNLGDVPKLSSKAMRQLITYPWPGNVRELENVLQRSAVMSEGEIIEPEDLQLSPAHDVALLPTARNQYQDHEARRILAALTASNWNVSRVSRELAIPRQTLYRKLKRYNLDRPE